MFAQAASCFEKAHNLLDRDIALAYQRRKDAPRQASSVLIRAAWKAAGEAFTACGDSAGKEGRPYHLRAVECFNAAEENDLATLATAKSLDETPAAKLLADKGRYEEAMALVRPSRGPSRVDDDVAQQITEQARLVWLQNQRYKYAKSAFLHSPRELMVYHPRVGRLLAYSKPSAMKSSLCTNTVFARLISTS